MQPLFRALAKEGRHLHLRTIEFACMHGVDGAPLGPDRSNPQAAKLRHIDARQSWVEALRDENIVKLIKVDTHDNLADLNSKLLNSVRFEYLVDKIMVRKALPTQPKAAASSKP